MKYGVHGCKVPLFLELSGTVSIIGLSVNWYCRVVLQSGGQWWIWYVLVVESVAGFVRGGGSV